MLPPVEGRPAYGGHLASGLPVHLHGEGPIIVRVLRDGNDGPVTVEVWDAGEGRPVVRPENYAASSGRGLLLMSELVQAWGVRPLNEGGKVAWATLR